MPGWYQGPWESDAAARQRCQELLRWLWAQEEGWIVLVVHGHLIDLLLKALLGIEDDEKEDQENENVMNRKAFLFQRASPWLFFQVVFFTANCATAHVSLRKDGSVGAS